jgi:hypothetical protein
LRVIAPLHRKRQMTAPAYQHQSPRVPVAALKMSLGKNGVRKAKRQPIVLINLLRYRHQVSVDGNEISGRQAYERYARALEPIIIGVGGRPLWRGQARLTLIGPPDERGIRSSSSPTPGGAPSSAY